MMAKKKKAAALVPSAPAAYGGLVTGIAELLEHARRGAARAVNSILAATYWLVAASRSATSNRCGACTSVGRFRRHRLRN